MGGVSGVSGWTVTANNVYETNGGNVGIGTNLVTTSALTVMNGNVGIGTWVRSQLLAVGNNNLFTVDSLGNVQDFTVYNDPVTNQADLSIYSTDAEAQGKGGTIGFLGLISPGVQKYFAIIEGAKENGISADTAGYLSLYTRLRRRQ